MRALRVCGGGARPFCMLTCTSVLLLIGWAPITLLDTVVLLYCCTAEFGRGCLEDERLRGRGGKLSAVTSPLASTTGGHRGKTQNILLSCHNGPQLQEKRSSLPPFPLYPLDIPLFWLRAPPACHCAQFSWGPASMTFGAPHTSTHPHSTHTRMFVALPPSHTHVLARAHAQTQTHSSHDIHKMPCV